MSTLAAELESFAFERERVLAKLDIRAAQLARRIAREVRVVLRGLPVATDDASRESVLETLGQLLVEAHQLLEGAEATVADDLQAQSGERPIAELGDEARRAIQARPTRPALETVPSVVVAGDEDDEDPGMNETIARRVVWERSGNRVLGG